VSDCTCPAGSYDYPNAVHEPYCALTRADTYPSKRPVADPVKQALIAMVYVHPCQCGDGLPQGMCARCRAVKVLGFDPAVIE